MVAAPYRVISDDLSNAAYWCKHWGVTLAQLRIAASRVGDQPERVLADITGRDERWENSKQAETVRGIELDDIPEPMLPAWLTAARAPMENKYLDY